MTSQETTSYITHLKLGRADTLFSDDATALINATARGSGSHLVTITTCMAQRSKAGSGKPGRTGHSRAPTGAVRLIVCTYPPQNGW